MLTNLKIGVALVALICIGGAPAASAVTAEIAKKCNALAAEAFPPRQAGNPAAGLAKGSAQDKRAYLQKCVASGGKMDTPSTTGAAPPTAGAK